MQEDPSAEMYKTILLDFSMPDMDGPETARQMRSLLAQHDAFQPFIICCTAYDTDHFIEIVYEAGMDKFFTKPVIAKDLLEAVRTSFEY